MASGEDLGGSAQSSAVLGSPVPNQRIDAFSSDEIAWADSCLINDPDHLGSNWGSLKDALLEIVDNEPQTLRSASSSQVDTEMSSSEGKAKQSEPIKISAEDYNEIDNSLTIEGEYDFISLLDFGEDHSGTSLQDAVIENHDGYLVVNDTNISSHNSDLSADRQRRNNSFLMNEDDEFVPSNAFKENLAGSSLQDTASSSHDKAHETVSEASDFLFNQTDELELPTRDIFKVWDLYIPKEEAEEDEFSTELDKALTKTPKGLEDESMDDLITSIADLSLSHKFT